MFLNKLHFPVFLGGQGMIMKPIQVCRLALYNSVLLLVLDFKFYSSHLSPTPPQIWSLQLDMGLVFKVIQILQSLLIKSCDSRLFLSARTRGHLPQSVHKLLGWRPVWRFSIAGHSPRPTTWQNGRDNFTTLSDLAVLWVGKSFFAASAGPHSAIHLWMRWCTHTMKQLPL